MVKLENEVSGDKLAEANLSQLLLDFSLWANRVRPRKIAIRAREPPNAPKGEVEYDQLPRTNFSQAETFPRLR
jgi:hypothetical protein